MHLPARHSSIVLICHFALFWIPVEGSAQPKTAINSHTEYVAAPFSLPTNNVGTTVGTLNLVMVGTITDIDIELSYQVDGSSTNVLRHHSFHLVSPNGTSIVLATGDVVGPGSLNGASMVETLFDDEAAVSINDGIEPYLGSFRPQGLLSSFDGESITGTWRLVVYRQTTAPGDVGWSLFIETDSSPPTPPPTFGDEYLASPLSLPPSSVGTTVGTLNIGDAGTITDVQVRVTYEVSSTTSQPLRHHSFHLVSPNGTSIVLATGDVVGPGSLNGASLYETLFDDEATVSVNNGVRPHIWLHRPQGLLSSFDGESITGTWRLVVAKSTSAPGDVSWSLFIAVVTRYVATTGNNTGNDCTVESNPCATIAYAVAQANPGDTLDIAPGIYNEPGLVIDKQLTILGLGVLVQ